MVGKDFLGFIKYIGTLWGVLGGITVVFPLADIILKRIPLPVDAYGNSTAHVAIPMTMMVALFTLFHTFVQRERSGTTSAGKAVLFFCLGLFCLVVFFLLDHFEQLFRERLFGPALDSSDDYVLLLLGVVPFYIAFFASITRAFAILALIEFQRDQTPD